MTEIPKPDDGNSAPSSAEDDLQRIRQLLFGNEQRRQDDFEARLTALQAQTEQAHKQLAAELESTRDDLAAKIEALREGKIEREDLAEMFGGIVSRLGNAAKQLGG